MNIDPRKNKIIKYLLSKIQHYDEEIYWTVREKVIDEKNQINIIQKLFYLYKIKKMDAYNNASMGTDLNKGAIFKSRPILPHGLNGIIISHHAKIGRNCTIFQQVTIGDDTKNRKNAPTIGDNCMIGAGAKIIGKIYIGNNVKIGTGCIVWFDIPDNATVVTDKPRVIVKNGGINKFKNKRYEIDWNKKIS